jgi:hypothetical protein
MVSFQKWMTKLSVLWTEDISVIESFLDESGSPVWTSVIKS